MPEVPQKFQMMGILQLAAGVCNVFFGWAVGSMVWGTVGTACSAIATLGLCPIGFLCGFVSFLIVPVGVIEIVMGLLMLISPQSVRGLVAWMPLLQIPMILLGDLISPVMGIVGFILGRDPEVIGFIEGM
ncbi:MAG: hypothetical protein R3F59_11845 [Myxococcota bacterium]